MSETTSSARPRALISRSALIAAATEAVAAGGSTADLRGDAWGHGLLTVAQAVTASGAAAVRVDSDQEVAALRLEGVNAVTEGDPDIDPLLLYGLPNQSGRLTTRPVMRLAGRVMSVKNLKAGDGVSYGYTHRAGTDTVVALVTGGYAQGIVRALGNQAHVEIAGQQHPIIGRVAMDVCVVDLENHETSVGAEVTYFGGRGSAAAGLASWSALTGLSVAELVAVAGAQAERGYEA